MKVLLLSVGALSLMGMIGASFNALGSSTASQPAPVVAAASTPQQVVDQHEIKMRWACEDAIKAQLNDPRSYEAERVRFAPQTMDEHPDQVVDAHIAFRARNGFGGMVGGFARCGINSQGEIVRQPNVVSN